jgi:hypothetical protein
MQIAIKQVKRIGIREFIPKIKYFSINIIYILMNQSFLFTFFRVHLTKFLYKYFFLLIMTGV